MEPESPTAPKPLNLFYSYSHKDDEYRVMLETHLIMLQRRGLIAGWSDREISAGTDWKGQIDDNLNKAALILLLVSSDFLASDYCYDIELACALKRDADKEARAIPIILRACDWKNSKMKVLQALPKDALPVKQWPDRDEAFLNVAQGIEKAVTELNQNTVEHYANFVKRWGVFEGVGRQLSDAEVRCRPNTLRFYRREGRVEKVQVVTGQGLLTGRHDIPQRTELSRQRLGGPAATECQWQFVRDAEGKLAYEWARDQANRLVYGLHYSPSADLKSVTAHYENDAGFPIVMTSSGAASMSIVRSADGYDQEVRYFDQNGQRQADDNGSYGERRELNSQGLPAKITNFGFDGGPAWRTDGYAQFRFAYDDLGNRTQSECLGLDGSPAWHSDGFSKMKAEFDQFGNQTAAYYYDDDGQPVRVKGGFARWTAKYDESGNQIELNCFDEAGKPAPQSDGYATWKAQYDALGRTVAVSFLDENGNAVKNRDGYATWRAKYDERDNQVEIAFLDEAGRPVRSLGGYAILTNEFDEFGRPKATAYLDETGKRTRGSDGYSRETVTYAGDNISGKKFFDESDRPVRHKDGYAGWTAYYDSRGKCLEWDCFDEAERPVPSVDGYSKRTNRYNARGNAVSEAYFDESGQASAEADPAEPPVSQGQPARFKSSHFSQTKKPVLNRKGYAAWDAQYDECGQQTEKAFFGTDGKPILLPEGYAGWVAQYDERGRQTEKTFLGPGGKPILLPDGYAGWSANYNGRGLQTELTYLGLDGQPVATKNGYVKWRAKYDQSGNRSELAYLTEDGKPARNQEAIATAIFQHDWRGNEVQVEYRDEAGQPARHRDGFMKCIRTFNAQDVIETKTFWGFDKAGGYFQALQKYDARGNVTENSYLDEQGQPALGEDGAAKWIAQYDAASRRVAQSFLGANGEAVHTKYGYTDWTRAFDEHGRAVSEEYLGFDAGRGFFRKSVAYEYLDRVMVLAYFDVQGGLATGPDGYAKLTVKYDDKDNRVEAKYDGRGNPVEVACYDAKDQPAQHQEGWSRWTADYDAQSNRVGEAYFGSDGKPALHPDGYARWRMQCNAHGQETELVFFDRADRPAPHKDGYARRTLAYDANGNAVEIQFFDADGLPVAIHAGYARQTATYDDHGTRTATAYFDSEGRPVTPLPISAAMSAAMSKEEHA